MRTGNEWGRAPGAAGSKARRSWRVWSLASAWICGALLTPAALGAAGAADESPSATLRGPAGVEARFAPGAGGGAWIGYCDPGAGRTWAVSGSRLSVQTEAGLEATLGGTRAGRFILKDHEASLETAWPALRLEVRQVFSFCGDGRTLRVRTALRAPGDPVAIRFVGLLDLEIAGQDFRLMGPETVSSPVFGDSLFAGLEHPSALCRAQGPAFRLTQPVHAVVGREWVEFPGAVLGSCSQADRDAAGGEALRRAFLRYLETVRVEPPDLHVHYNDWWTAPVPSSEAFVLRNLAELKRGLYDATGFFFDSYALDAGWSNPKSAWEMDTRQFPQRFAPIRAALEGMGSHVGLWISPSSLYPFALDNRWLESAGYEVTPHATLGATACLARGGKYQAAFKAAALRYAAEARLAHLKFDGFVPQCDVASHGHPVGADSCLPLAEGLIEVFDALRARNPAMALEPTCFGYRPSPWWLMHVPFIIGPFGDDSPYGRCPAPDYVESMTTAREIENLRGREAFLMPSAALQCFDIIVQCPGAFQNHAVMAVGRGRWFVSCYIDPKYMDRAEWRFFAELMRWARHHRAALTEPLPFGGDPEKRQAYGYRFEGGSRQWYCLRNPWMEETTLRLPLPSASRGRVELRLLYPRRQVLARLAGGAPGPLVPLGPYETQFLEAVPTDRPALAFAPRPEPRVAWNPAEEPGFERIVFDADPPACGPSWTSPDGEEPERTRFTVSGRLVLRRCVRAQLCVLCEGGVEVGLSSCEIAVDGRPAAVALSTSEGAFGAAGAGQLEHWAWHLADLPPGGHRVRIDLGGPALTGRIGVFVRGDTATGLSPPPFESGPAFPLYQDGRVPWSRVLVPLAARQPESARTRRAARRIARIDGVYLDALEWTEATAGWGKVQRNRSVMGKTLTLGGRRFLRGIGSHAASRVVFDLPGGYRTFAATVGKDQEVSGGSVVFVVQVDGREVFRSGVVRDATPPQDLVVPVAQARRLALVVENAGDDIMADHADWADARLLK